jgi:hypothetical protein
MRSRPCAIPALLACLCFPAAAQTGPAAGKTGEPLQATDPIRVAITSPRENEVVSSGSVTFSFDVKNYNLAPGGNHLHLIVDGKPYQAVYDPASFTYPETLSEGVHTAVAFASRPWHETWKDAESIDVITFYVGKNTGERPIDYSKPLLLFSRPKGTQEGPDVTKPTNAARVLLDFYLWNVNLSAAGYKVQVGIDGELFYTDQWRPFWVTGLKNGNHTFTMRLLDQYGRPVFTPYAPYSRTIEVKDAPPTADGKITVTPVVPGPDSNGFNDAMGHMM